MKGVLARSAVILGRSGRLRCPACGRGKMFRGWLTMNPRCEHCGLSFEREPGFYLGSIYVNYGLTALVLVATYFPLVLFGGVSPTPLLWIGTAFCFLFPLWFFRYARSIWLGFDQCFDPSRDPRAGKH